MILDIKYVCGDGRPPIQLQGVRMYTIYPNALSPDDRIAVVHFTEYTRPAMYIELGSVDYIQVTND